MCNIWFIQRPGLCYYGVVKRNDSFISTYPLPGVLLFLILAFASIGFALITGAPQALEAVQDKAVLLQLADSLCLATACTLVSLLFGLGGARMLAKGTFPLPGLMKWLSCILTLVPSFFIRLSFSILPLPPFGKPWIWEGVVLALFSVPAVVFILGSFLARLDSEPEQCALSLKTPSGRVRRTISRPRRTGAAAAAGLYVFVRCLAYTGARFAFGTSLFAATDAICTIVGILVVIPAALCSDRAMKSAGKGGAGAEEKPSSAAKVIAVLYEVLSFAVFDGPLVLMALKSVRSEGKFSFTAYTALFRTLFAPGTRPFICTLILLSSVLISMLIALRTSRGAADSPFILAIALLPLAAGPSAVGSGMRAVFSYIPQVPLIVPGILAHTVIEIPFMTLILVPAVRRVPQTLRQASMSLGYSESRSFAKIDRKILAPHIGCACCVGAVISLSDFSAAFSCGLLSVPVQIHNLTSSGDMQSACALGFILTVVCLLLVSAGRSMMWKSHV